MHSFRYERYLPALWLRCQPLRRTLQSMEHPHPRPETPASAPTGDPRQGAEVDEQGRQDTTPAGEGSRTHDPRTPVALVELMSRDWDTTSTFPEHPHPATTRYASRRCALSALFPGIHLVIPTGAPKVRANDTEYRFRPGSDHYWLTGHTEPGAVLLLRAEGEGHRATLYVEPRADRSSPAFFTNARSGELWVGPRRGVPETAYLLGIECAALDGLAGEVRGLEGQVLLLRGLDPEADTLVAALDDPSEERRLAQQLGALRLVKDDHEIRMLERAVAATVHGFEDVVRSLPEAMEQGERVVEGVFNLRARVEGNDVGYETIAASGAHATILHWSRNDGEVRSGDLLLLDAGVECDELYTADVTRTLPVSGRFTPEQRRLYELVHRAQQAALAEVRPGAAFLDPHRAAMRVLAEGLEELGILPVSSERALAEDVQAHRRYTLHGTSHMLGLDVHDCAQAREEEYRGGRLQPGHVLTVEPGLYLQPDDLTVPEQLRGIGIRIEDDVLVTEDGCRVLSEALPSDPDAVERWMAGLRGQELQLRRPLD
jgi:Xaa-Pro aminopeptidase